MTTITIGKIVNESFEPDLYDQFETLRSSFYTFVQDNELEDEEKKKSILLLSLRVQLQELLKKLSTQDELDKLSSEEILERFEQHFVDENTAGDDPPTQPDSRNDCVSPGQRKPRSSSINMNGCTVGVMCNNGRVVMPELKVTKGKNRKPNLNKKNEGSARNSK